MKRSNLFLLILIGVSKNFWTVHNENKFKRFFQSYNFNNFGFSKFCCNIFVSFFLVIVQLLPMATACFLLNIAPYKNNNENCLDITQKVLLLQNIEINNWIREHGLIEYTVPFKYQVKVKEKPTVEESVNDIDKTYHSCVDLLLPSSLTKLNLENDNRVKIISDTYIHSKVSARFDNVNNSSDCALASSATDNLVIKKVVDLNDNNVCTMVELHNSGENFIQESREDIVVTGNDDPSEKIIKFNSHVSIYHLFITFVIFSDTENTQNYNTNKIIHINNSNNDQTTNIDVISSNTKLMNTQSIETTSNIYVTKAKNKDTVKRLLDMSPICSVDIDHNFKSMTNTPVNSSVTKYDYLPGIVKNSDRTASIENISDNIKLNKYLIETFIEENEKSFQRVINKIKARELPEVRIKTVIKSIEEEILPLKIMLNEIISKCISLGVTLNKSL